jgi:hypothetical protein
LAYLGISNLKDLIATLDHLSCPEPPVGGLARSLLESKDNPAGVERIAKELLTLEPHLIELLIAEGEKASALTQPPPCPARG